MTDPRTYQPPPEPGSLRLILVMGAVGLIASVLLVATYQITSPYIAANRAAFLEQAVFDVLPGAVRKVTFVRSGDGSLVPAVSGNVEEFRLHAGYDADDALVGVAVEGQGQGFQDVLSLLYGYVPECACIVGMKVLASKETPGLGDKIETDPEFRSNFDSLSAELNDGKTGLRNRISMVKKGTEAEEWQITAITGATISSRAVATIIDGSAEDVLPLIHENLDALRMPPPASDDEATPEIPETPQPPPHPDRRSDG